MKSLEFPIIAPRHPAIFLIARLPASGVRLFPIGNLVICPWAFGQISGFDGIISPSIAAVIRNLLFLCLFSEKQFLAYSLH